MSKNTFACKTFAPRTFESGNWAGVGVIPPTPPPPSTGGTGGGGVAGRDYRPREQEQDGEYRRSGWKEEQRKEDLRLQKQKKDHDLAIAILLIDDQLP